MEGCLLIEAREVRPSRLNGIRLHNGWGESEHVQVVHLGLSMNVRV